mmetsp:Transcript_6195/g.5574  ORF Transcript_6195/g.5574 Transcript_6195/m.5574 type:complete len:80 (+) Transcript_6195:817-1056(+)
MGLSYDANISLLYSIGEDSKFKVTDMKLKNTIFEVSPGKAGLKYMIHDTSRATFIIGDGDGFIYLYSSLTNPPEYMANV